MEDSSINQIGESTNDYTTNVVNYTQNVQTDNTPGNLENDSQNSGTSSDNGGISQEAAKKATDKINKLLEDTSTHIEYEQDKNLKQVMIMKVVENGTNKVLREVPSKQVLEMLSDFSRITGLLINGKY